MKTGKKRGRVFTIVYNRKHYEMIQCLLVNEPLVCHQHYFECESCQE